MAKMQRNYTGDRISMLPDDVLGLILSSLSLKEATRTSVLCSRWRYLWTLTSKLDLDVVDWINTFTDYNIHTLRCKYARWVDRLLTLIPKSSPNLVQFRVFFDLSSYFTEWIDAWISYAVNRKVENLDLILNARSANECYFFPYEQGNFPDNLKLLKKLSLSCVNVSGEAVAFLLGNCRLLEQLSVSGTDALSSLEVVGTSPVFKTLEIGRCASLKSVVVRESKVVCIKYASAGKRDCRFVLADVPLLTELWIQAWAEEMLYFDEIRKIIDMFDIVLPQLTMLKIYSLFRVTCNDTLPKMMPSLKELVVVVGSDYRDNCSLAPIISWFSVAPCLRRFVIEASHQDISEEEKMVQWTPKMFSKYHLLNGSNHDVSGISRKTNVRRAYSHIKEIKFVGYRGVCNHLQMITQLVQHGVALDKIILDSRSFELCENMPWDRISRNQMKDEIFARRRAKDQLKHLYVTSRINVNIL